MPNDIVLVPGRFAVIHPGHVRLFRYAASLCQEVVVALDATGIDVEEIAWRVGALEGIPYVNKVVRTSDRLGQVIEEFKPKFVLRGLEFRDKEFPESEILKRFGGKLVFSSGNYLFNAEDLIPLTSVQPEKFWKLANDYVLRNSLSEKKVNDWITNFSGKKVLVVGDSIVDEIIMCHPLGMSQEEPSIVVSPIEEKRFVGGAAIVASHTAGLGAETSFVSVSGNDSAGEWVAKALGSAGVETRMFCDDLRKTTLKRRYRTGRQTLFRLTELTTETINQDFQERVYKSIANEIVNLDAIIFSDFSYGMFDDQFTKSLISLAKRNSVFTSADSQSSSQIGNLSKFRGVDLVTPTEREARQELRDERSGVVQIAEGIQKKPDCKIVLLKLGSDGVLLHGIDSMGGVLRTDRIPALNSSPIDVSGAGDSLLASSTLALISGADIYGTALIGSIAAAMQVSRVGNTPIQIEELRREVIAT